MTMDFSKILVTGSRGMMGSYVDFGTRTDRDSLDVTDPAAIETAFLKYKPETVLHLGAYTDVEGAESNPGQAYLINTMGTAHIAQAARKHGAKLVYISTSGVFDGLKKGLYEPQDAPNPETVYGKSKYYGEVLVQGMLTDYLICRVCWVFGGGPGRDKKFFGKVMKQLIEEKKDLIKATNDVIGSPTYAKDALENVKTLMAGNKKGVFHISNTGSVTRYDVATHMLRYLNRDVRIKPVPTSFFNPKAPIVVNEAMSSQGARPWQDALEEYVRDEWKEYIAR